MPIIFVNEAESDKLSGKKVAVPKEVSANIKNALNVVDGIKAAHKSKGYKRAKTLVSSDDYNKRSTDKNTTEDGRKIISFSDLKRIANDMSHMPQSKDNLQYVIQGGDETRNWVNKELAQMRSSVGAVRGVKPVSVPSMRKNAEIKPVPTVKKVGEGKKTVYVTEENLLKLKENITTDI